MYIELLCSGGGAAVVVGGGGVKQNTRQLCNADTSGLLWNDFFPPPTHGSESLHSIFMHKFG